MATAGVACGGGADGPPPGPGARLWADTRGAHVRRSRGRGALTTLVRGACDPPAADGSPPRACRAGRRKFHRTLPAGSPPAPGGLAPLGEPQTVRQRGWSPRGAKRGRGRGSALAQRHESGRGPAAPDLRASQRDSGRGPPFDIWWWRRLHPTGEGPATVRTREGQAPGDGRGGRMASFVSGFPVRSAF